MENYQEEAVSEVAVAMVAPLNVEVPEVRDNPKSSSPVLFDDGELFMNIYDRAELQLFRA